ncbi:MAG: diguanylate cyclase [Spirochaetales bacterium]|nr:MAG: diguanylate cyclase [Spirochaetales bacterium]
MRSSSPYRKPYGHGVIIRSVSRFPPMPTETQKLRILVCGHFLRETRAIVTSGDFPDVEVRSYALDCGHPQLSESVSARIAKAGGSSGEVVLMVAGCLPGTFDTQGRIPAFFRIHRVEQCFTLLADSCLIDELMLEGAYILTPGWLSGWRSRLSRWGFDQATARTFFAESAKRLVLLDTGVDNRSADALEEFSEYIERPHQTITVGLDHYRMVLTRIIQDWRLEKMSHALEASAVLTSRKQADEAMFLDVLTGLTHLSTESEAADRILGLFDMLFAPRRMVYASVQDGHVTDCRAQPLPAPEILECQDWIDSPKELDQDSGGRQGFFLRFTFHDELLGLLKVDELAFPERRIEYYNLAASIAQVCGLAISNARMYQNLQHQAITDSLTGLFNRGYLFERAAQEFERANRYDHFLAALMIDIDFFKNINDTYGHHVGDEVLIEVAHCIRDELRAIDICGRYGGEEFVVILPETGSEMTLQVAERIRLKIEGLDLASGNRQLKVTVSIGVAVMDGDCHSLEALLQRSDRALYAAKESGRNRVSAWPGN